MPSLDLRFRDFWVGLRFRVLGFRDLGFHVSGNFRARGLRVLL